jgi:hypothetical protein
MLGSLGQRQLPGHPACLSRCTSLRQGGRRVRLEVVDPQCDHVRLWAMHVYQLWHLHGAIARGAVCGDVDMPPITPGLDAEKARRCACPAIRRIVPSGRPGARWHGWSRLPAQWHRPCVPADVRTPPSRRLGIQGPHLLPLPDNVQTHTGDAPCFARPWRAVVVVRTRRPVSSETASTPGRAPQRSAHHGLVPCTRPAGGVRQARATQQASCVPAHVWRAPGRLRAVRARGRPAATHRCRVRWTVERPTRTMAALSSAVAPAAAWSSRWAQATWRADGFPCLISILRQSRRFYDCWPLKGA